MKRLSAIFVVAFLIAAGVWVELRIEGRRIGGCVREASVLSSVARRGGAVILEPDVDREAVLNALARTYEKARASAHAVRLVLLRTDGENAKALFLAAERERNLVAEPRGIRLSFVQDLAQAQGAFEAARGRFELDRGSWVVGDSKQEIEAEADAVRVPLPASVAVRETMSSMRTLAIVFEAYAVDHNVYPEPRNLEALAVPTYIKTGAYLKRAMIDGWGTPLRITVSSDHRHYQFVSAGADRIFNESTWAINGESTDASEDFVYADGTFKKWFRNTERRD